MDNGPANKNWGVLSGLAALVCTGICEKVKLSFCLSHHCHTDIDATIAKVVDVVNKKDLHTFDELKDACTRAIAVSSSKVIDVVQLVGVPAYVRGLEEFKNERLEKITYVKRAHEYRFTPSKCLTKVDMFYREDLRLRGWLPRFV